MSVSLIVAAVVIGVTLLIATVQDIRTRTVYRATWYPAIGAGVICAAIYWWHTLPETALIFALSLGLAVIFILFAVFGLFGKADAFAITIIAIGIPVTPFAVWIFPSLAISTVINACVLSLVVPVTCLIYNAVKKNKAPFSVRCSGFPVKSSALLKHNGFIAEEIMENSRGEIDRTFRKAQNIFSALREKSPIFIRYLRENPLKYANEIARYERAGYVWIRTGIPFLVPLTAGFLLALFGISVVDFVLSLLLL